MRSFLETPIAKEKTYGEPVNLMWISPANHSVAVDYEKISSIFLQEEVAGRKIVAVSIIGALRKGKSFFMAYCLRYMYANVRTFNDNKNFIMMTI